MKGPSAASAVDSHIFLQQILWSQLEFLMTCPCRHRCTSAVVTADVMAEVGIRCSAVSRGQQDYKTHIRSDVMILIFWLYVGHPRTVMRRAGLVRRPKIVQPTVRSCGHAYGHVLSILFPVDYTLFLFVPRLGRRYRSQVWQFFALLSIRKDMLSQPNNMCTPTSTTQY
jgi:hypothetical protein